MLKQFISDVERARLPVVVIIPGVVIHELDSQKHGTHDSLGWFARTASTWLLEKVKERRSVKAQAQDETCKKSKNWKTRDPGEAFGERHNDSLILDCCMYFASKYRTALCSADKILCIECESQKKGALCTK